ncbi:MAG TPA: glycosyltransferase family 1 protein [Longimicrobiales bacterium]|nr:glycosyltransferase family 1 protein [Longimicrobiales bacterium]
MMRIGVDAACLANARGYGRFTRELLKAMFALAPDDEFVLFLDEQAQDHIDFDAPNVRAVSVDQRVSPTRAAAADTYRSPGDMLRFSAAVWRERPDVFFSPSVYTYFPLPPRIPALVAIHDAIAERYPELTLPGRRARLFWNLKVRLALWQADLILTVSDYAALELQEVLHLAPGRIRVAVEAPAAGYRPSDSRADVQAAATRLGLPDGARWYVYVGGFNPHKRVDRIVRAHARLVAERPADPVHLLLVGTTSADVFHGEVEHIRRTVAELGTGELVHWTGWIPDDELRHIHSGAIALVLPSESEGFGLPAVEAAACGTPVIATTASPLPQLLEGGGIFIQPGDEDALTAALLRLSGDEDCRRRFGAVARTRAAALCWDTSAHATLGALREVVA